MKKKLIILFCFIFYITSYCKNNVTNYNYDTVILDININEIDIPEYEAIYDYENDILLIDIKDFLTTLGVKEFSINKNKIEVFSNGKKQEFRADNFKNINKSYYLTPEEIIEVFDDKGGEWDSSQFKLYISPPFETNIDIEKRLMVQREIMTENYAYNQIYEERIEGQGKFFSKGIVGLRYSYSDLFSDFNKDFNTLQLDYTNQLLKGDLYLQYNLLNEQKLNYIQWKYPNLYKDYNLYLGDVGAQTTEGIPGVSIRGISIAKTDNFGVSQDGNIYIEGDSKGATYAELYYDDNLLDFYMLPLGSTRYYFKESKVYGNLPLRVKLYFSNGETKEEDVRVLGDSSVLNQGETDFVFQYGEDDNKDQLVTRFAYGVSNFLTLGVSAYSIENSLTEYKILGVNPVLSTPIGTIFGVYYSDEDRGDNSYKIGYKKSFKNLGLYANYEKWGSGISLDKLYTEKQEIGLYFTIFKGVFDINYERFMNLGEEEWINFGGDTDYILFQNLKKGWYNEIETSYDYFANNDYSFRFRNRYVWNDESKNNYFNAGFIYDGFSTHSVGIYGDYIHNDYQGSKSSSIGYELRVSSKPYHRYSSLVDYDLYAYYDEVRKFTFGVGFTVYFEKGVQIELPVEYYDKEIRAGINMRKEINLDMPLKNVKYSSLKAGYIRGKVFKDQNNNGVLDKNEEGIPNVIVYIDGEPVVTDKYGEYLYNGVSSESFSEVEIELETLEAGRIPKHKKIKIKPRAGSGLNYNIPTVQSSGIECFVGRKTSKFEKVQLINEKNQVIDVQPISKGLVIFGEVPPGEYRFKTLYSNEDFTNKVILEKYDYRDDIELY